VRRLEIKSEDDVSVARQCSRTWAEGRGVQQKVPREGGIWGVLLSLLLWWWWRAPARQLILGDLFAFSAVGVEVWSLRQEAAFAFRAPVVILPGSAKTAAEIH
jgi:hypothetical protein